MPTGVIHSFFHHISIHDECNQVTVSVSLIQSSIIIHNINIHHPPFIIHHPPFTTPPLLVHSTILPSNLKVMIRGLIEETLLFVGESSGRSFFFTPPHPNCTKHVLLLQQAVQVRQGIHHLLMVN